MAKGERNSKGGRKYMISDKTNKHEIGERGIVPFELRMCSVSKAMH